MFAVVRDVWDYVTEMIPLGLAALIVFFLFRPARQKRLRALNLTSSGLRETAMVLFVAYSAGLAALTLFPANLWSYVFDWMFRHKTWEMIWSGQSLLGFYPAWEETASNFAYLPQIFSPFEEIRRALRARSYWLWFMLLGNIIMFMPIGFFPALLWRRQRWWKSLLAGFCASASIEFIQFFIGRSTDIDDVILNTAGTLLGFWIFLALRAIFPDFINKFHCQPRGGYNYG